MKTVLITGASRGIGRELALAFGKAGYAVGVNCLREEAKAQTVVQEIIQAGNPNADIFVGDVRDSLKVRQLMDAFVKRWNSFDVLINNAGITRDCTLLKMTNGEWNDVIDTNLSGTFWCVREAARLMSPNKKGSIINIVSIMGVRGGYGNANYAASKAGVIGLTQTAARELGRLSIRVNAVLPGFHKTDMSAHLSKEIETKVMSEHILGTSTQVSDLSSFLLGLSENQSISGQVFSVDNRIA